MDTTHRSIGLPFLYTYRSLHSRTAIVNFIHLVDGVEIGLVIYCIVYGSFKTKKCTVCCASFVSSQMFRIEKLILPQFFNPFHCLRWNEWCNIGYYYRPECKGHFHGAIKDQDVKKIYLSSLNKSIREVSVYVYSFIRPFFNPIPLFIKY